MTSLSRVRLSSALVTDMGIGEMIDAATAGALMGLFRSRIPDIVAAICVAVQRDLEEGLEAAAVTELYRKLLVFDFSRDILAGQEAKLRVPRVRACGWSDLGTLKRVVEILHRGCGLKGALAGKTEHPECLSLAAQHERMRVRGYRDLAVATQMRQALSMNDR